MTLFLDPQQRINVVALLGQQPGNISEMRIIWKLLDRIELNESEKEEMEFRIISQNGIEGPIWNPLKVPPAKAFELSDQEFSRVKKVVEEYTGYRTGDRRWLESLLEQFITEPVSP